MRTIRSTLTGLMLFALCICCCCATYAGDEDSSFSDEDNIPTTGCGETEDDSSCSDCEEEEEEDSTSTDCVRVKIFTGNMRPGTSLPRGLFKIHQEKPSPGLSTPQLLKYAVGYSIRDVSREKTSAGVPRDVVVLDNYAFGARFRFNNDASVAGPIFGTPRLSDARLMMVDAQGWAVTNDPAYYEFYPSNGDMYRFVASTNSDDYLQLDLYRAVSGREETLQEIGTEIIRDDDGILRQVMAPSRLADIIVTNEYKYSINFYRRTDVQSEKDENGYYVPETNAQPIKVFVIENPETNTIKKLRVTKIVSSRTNVSDFVYTEGSQEWKLTKGGGLRVEARDIVEDDQGNDRLLTFTVWDTENNIVKKVSKKFHMYEWDWGALMEKIVDPDGAALKTEHTYYVDQNEPATYGRRKTWKEPGGWWKSRYFNTNGYKSVDVTAYKDAVFDSPATNARATYYDYTPVDTNDSSLFNDRRPRTVTEKVLGQTVAKTFNAYVTNAVRELREIEEKCVDPNASYGDTNNLRTTTTYFGTNTSNHQIGRIKSIEYPDERLDTYSYEYGNYHPSNASPEDAWFEPDTNGAAWRETIVHGTTNSPDGIASNTTKEVRVLDSFSQKVLTETYVHTGSTNYERIAWTVREFNDFYKPTKIYSSTGTEEDATWAACGCGKASETDASGTQRTFDYDLLNRLITATKKGTNSPTDDVKTEYTWDAADRRLTEKISGGALSMVTSSNRYDLVGRRTNSVNSRGIETTYGYQNGGRITTVDQAGLTNVTENYLDGRTKSITLNSVLRTYYEYGVNTNGTQWTIMYTGPDSTNSPMWVKTTTDLLGRIGRTIKEEEPGFAGVTNTATYTYNSKGQLDRITRTGIADTLYEYNEIGELVKTCLDIDSDGTIDESEADRITEIDRYLEKDGSNDWWWVTVNAVYSTANTNTITTHSISKTRLTGFAGSDIAETISEDVLGNEIISVTSAVRTNRTVTRAINYPESTNDAVSVTVNGLLTSSTTKTGLEYTYFYDGLERRTGETDPRIGTATTHFNLKGQVDYVEDSATNRTSYAYSTETGRRIAVTNALGKVVRYSYTDQGQPEKTWGDTVYPVSYSYNDYGWMTNMTTYRGGSGWNGETWPTNTGTGDTTTWIYDETTGLLTNKLYADGNGISYTYASDGKLASRAWARGITTTYSYTNSTGEMMGIDYSDSTPDISFTYNRIGQQVTVDDAQGTRTFAYNSSLRLESETIVAGGVTNVITRSYETNGVKGRNTGFDLDSTYDIDYGFDNMGRFSSLFSVVNSTTNNFNYTYLANSDTISGMSNSILNATRSFEANRNLITQVLNQTNGATLSQYDYSNDVLGRRTQRIDTLAAVTTNDFAYNDRSELIDADMGTNLYDYVFDNIGNRQSVSNNAEVLTYLANQLNQYTNIANGMTNIPTYDADGNMLTYNGWAYMWNGENRMVSASNGSTVVGIVYDYIGRRVSKTTNGVTISFLYDGWNLIRESLSSETNHYVWGLDLSGSLQGAGGIGGLLSRTTSSGDVHLYSFDANGNVMQMVDASDSSVDAEHEYDPFGNIIKQTGDVAGDNMFRFSTKCHDDETELLYYGYRYYSSELGRWLSRDPLFEGLLRSRQSIGELAAARQIAISRISTAGRDYFQLDSMIKQRSLILKAISRAKRRGQYILGEAIRLRVLPKIDKSIARFRKSIDAVPSGNNLYMYCFNSPQHFIDPYGLDAAGAATLLCMSAVTAGCYAGCSGDSLYLSCVADCLADEDTGLSQCDPCAIKGDAETILETYGGTADPEEPEWTDPLAKFDEEDPDDEEDAYLDAFEEASLEVMLDIWDEE